MKIKHAIIGCGRISHKHIEALINNNDRIELLGVCDLIKERAEYQANDYKKALPENKVEIFTDHKKMLETIKPDSVSIATESGYHARIAIDSIEMGCHVVIEKPMALSTKDADMIIDTALKHKKKIAVCYQNRFNLPIQRAYKAYKDGRFGRIMHGMIQIRWNRNENYYKQALWRGAWELDGGTLMNQCTHGIDLLQWLMGGDIKRVYGVTRRFLRPIEAEDFGSAILEFQSGAVGIIEGTAVVFPTNLSEVLSIFGDRGTVVVGGMAVNKSDAWRFADSEKLGDTEEIVLNHREADPPTVYGFGHTGFYADFADSILNNRQPFINGEAGKKSLEIVLGIYRSMLEGRAIEFPSDFDTNKMKGVFD